jgi:hypothetical protein
MKRTGLALSLVFAIAGAAAAAPPPDERVTGAPGGTPRREGEYGGVNPAASASPSDTSAKPATRPAAKQTLAWIGFTTKADGSSEVFFQAATSFSVHQRIEGTTLIVLLAGLRRQARNTTRPLDTRFFESAVSRVTARERGAVHARKGQPARPAGVEVRIEFRNPKDIKEGSVRSETGNDGLSYAYVGFGPSSAPAAPVAAPADDPVSEPE